MIVEVALIVLAFVATIVACVGDSSKQDAKGRQRLTPIGMVALLVAFVAMLGNVVKSMGDQQDKSQLLIRVTHVSSELSDAKRKLVSANEGLEVANRSLAEVIAAAAASNKSLEKMSDLLHSSSERLTTVEFQNRRILLQLEEAVKVQDDRTLKEKVEDILRRAGRR